MEAGRRARTEVLSQLESWHEEFNKHPNLFLVFLNYPESGLAVCKQILG